MSKRIQVPDKFKLEKTERKPERFIKNPWPGSVTIADPMTMQHIDALENALGEGELNAGAFFSVQDKRVIPALLVCVEKWNLDGLPEELTEEDLLRSPRRANHELIDFILMQILEVYSAEEEIPNG